MAEKPMSRSFSTRSRITFLTALCGFLLAAHVNGQAAKQGHCAEREKAMALAVLSLSTSQTRVCAVLEAAGLGEKAAQLAQAVVTSRPAERLQWARSVAQSSRFLVDPVEALAAAVLVGDGTTSDAEEIREKLLDVETRRLAGRLEYALRGYPVPPAVRSAAGRLFAQEAQHKPVAPELVDALKKEIVQAWAKSQPKLGPHATTTDAFIADRELRWWPIAQSAYLVISQDTELAEKLWKDPTPQVRAAAIALLAPIPEETTVGKLAARWVGSYLEETSPTLVEHEELSAAVLDFYMMRRQVPEVKMPRMAAPGASPTSPSPEKVVKWWQTPMFFLPHYHRLLWLYVRADAVTPEMKNLFQCRRDNWVKHVNYTLKTYGFPPFDVDDKGKENK